MESVTETVLFKPTKAVKNRGKLESLIKKKNKIANVGQFMTREIYRKST